MNKVWRSQEAKNKFSNLVNKARNERPQISYKNTARGLLSFLKDSPLFDTDIDLARGKGTF